MNYRKWISQNTDSLLGKDILIVGATGSIGVETMKALLSLRASVTIGARNKGKAEKIASSMQEEFPSSSISIEEVDVSSFASIDAFVCV